MTTNPFAPGSPGSYFEVLDDEPTRRQGDEEYHWRAEFTDRAGAEAFITHVCLVQDENLSEHGDYRIRESQYHQHYPAAPIVVTLTVENTYAEHEDVTWTIRNAIIEPPPPDQDCDDYREWEQTWVIDLFTGAGHTTGDSWYDIEITDSSDPALKGHTITWGY